MPESWIKRRSAGPDWFASFMKGHPNLSIRQPEVTSLSLATSFIRHNVSLLFSKLAEVIDRFSFHNQVAYGTLTRVV